MNNVDVNATLAKLELLRKEFEAYKNKNGVKETKTKAQKQQTIVRKRVPMELVINDDRTCSILNVPYDAKGRISGSGTSTVHYSTGRPQPVDQKHHVQLSIIEYNNKW